MCDTFVATAKSTGCDHLIFGKNSDREPNEAQAILRVPARRHPEETLRATYIEIPQVPQTYEVLLSKPFQMWGAEMGANEHGLVIGNEAVFTRVKFNKKRRGLTGMDLLRLALERCTSARQAIDTIVALLETHGQDAPSGYRNRNFYYHNSFLIADRQEAHVLETAGRQWASCRVDGFYAISNGLTIEESCDRVSRDCAVYAQNCGWAGKAGRLNFRQAYSDRLMTFFSKCRLRRSRAMEMGREASGSLDVRKAMQILRTEGQPGQAGPFHPARSDMGSLCMHATGILVPSQTAGSLVAEIRPDAPSTFWMTGTCIPAISLYIPFVIPGTAIRQGEFAEPSAHADQSLWWRHAALYRRCLENYPELTAAFRDDLKALQKDFLDGEERIVASGGDFSSAMDQFSRDCLKKTRDAIALWEARANARRVPRVPFAPLYRYHWQRWNRQAGISA
jgi:dipeptidase